MEDAVSAIMGETIQDSGGIDVYEVWICVCIYIYIYIYIERERERERQTEIDR